MPHISTPTRTLLTSAGALLAAVLLLSPALAGARAAASTVSTHRSSLGSILVNSQGRTLFAFTRDRHDRDTCHTIPGCNAVWPVAAATGRAHATGGVRASLLGTIRLPGGKRQLTYAGHPLYTYAFDDGPAETGYVGAHSFGGVWHALRATGALVR